MYLLLGCFFHSPRTKISANTGEVCISDDVDFKADTMQDEQEFEHPLIKELEGLMGKVKEKFII